MGNKNIHGEKFVDNRKEILDLQNRLSIDPKGSTKKNIFRVEYLLEDDYIGYSEFCINRNYKTVSDLFFYPMNENKNLKELYKGIGSLAFGYLLKEGIQSFGVTKDYSFIQIIKHMKKEFKYMLNNMGVYDLEAGEKLIQNDDRCIILNYNYHKLTEDVMKDLNQRKGYQLDKNGFVK